MDTAPRVSIVMAVRNEGASLASAFDAIDAQTYPASRVEILVVDGGSTDQTLSVVKERMLSDNRVRLLGGPGVNTPLAMELGRNAATGEIVAKVDGHGWINERFVGVAVDVLGSDARIGCVGGIIHPIATTVVERAIAAARFSRLGVGGGVYTLSELAQDTDTVQCGVYRRDALADAGGFDPDFQFGEDEELNFRLRQRGWRIRMDPRMRFWYRVRPSMLSLGRQYFHYGRARVAVVRKHPNFFRVKHAAPAGLVVGLAGGAVLTLTTQLRLIGLIPWIAYACALSIGSAYLGLRHHFARIDLIAVSLAALHLGYGVGTLAGVVGLLRRRSDRTSAGGT